MANYATLKAAIIAAIKQNGNNEITGNLLQQQLLAIVNSLGVGYQFAGIATPATNPGTPDQNVFYIASTAGTYTNFGGLVLADGEIAILEWNGAWAKDSTGAASLQQVSEIDMKIAPVIIGASFNNSSSSTKTSLFLTQGNTYKITLISKDSGVGDVYLRIVSVVSAIGYLRVGQTVEFIASESGFISFFTPGSSTGNISVKLELVGSLDQKVKETNYKINDVQIDTKKTTVPFVFDNYNSSNGPISVKSGQKYIVTLVSKNGLSGDYYLVLNNTVQTSIGYLTTDQRVFVPDADGVISLYTNSGAKTGTVTVSFDNVDNVFNTLERKNFKLVDSLRLTHGAYSTSTGAADRAANNDPIYNGTFLGMLKRWARTFEIVYIEKDSYIVNDSATIYNMRVCKYNTKDESSFVSGSTVGMTSKKMHTFTETGYYSLSFERASSTNFDLEEINTNFRFHIMTNFDEIGVFASFIGCGQANGGSPIYGDCTLFITPNGKSILIDMGTPAAEVGNIRRWLFNYGVIKIDYAIISHYHEDHAGGIWQEINSNKTIDFSHTTFFLPDNAAAAYAFEHAEEYHLTAGSINAYNGLTQWLNSENFLGQKIYPTASACDYDADGVSLHFWNTDHSVYSLPGDDNYNDYSLCCDVCFGSQKIGMTGDLGPIGERTTKDDVYKVNLMKAQHHGYEHDPMNVDWINHICPDIVVSEDWTEHNAFILTKDAPLQSWCEANGVPNYRVAINSGIEVYIFKESLQIFNIVQKYIRGGSNFSVPYGDTAGRPYAANMRIGTMYFDQTLGKPIFWTGSAWVDATGTTV